MSENAETIALILSLSHSYCRQVLRGIRRYARSKDWLLYPMVPQPDLRRSIKHLKPAGIIAHAFNEKIAHSLRGLNQPVVNVSRADPKMPFPQVNVEEEKIGLLAAEHLMECGLRNFAYFGPQRYGPDSGREGGFCQTLKKIDHTIAVRYTETSLFDPNDIMSANAEVTRKWIRSLPKPVGVFAMNDPWAAWFADLCRQEGVRVPDDVAIIGVDNDELLCEVAHPSLSSISIPAERVGFEAAALLDRLIGGAASPKHATLLEPLGVVARQSSDLSEVDDPDIAAAIRYIREHAWNPIAIADIVKSVAISRRSLERKFQTLLGHSPTKEIQRLRIKRAKSLLERSDLKVAHIARRCGFSSAKQFTASFHQATGITPSIYRRQLDAATEVPPAFKRI